MTMTTNRYQDSTLSISERVQALLAEMTVEEKLAQLAGIWVTDLIDVQTREFSPSKTQNKIGHGIGHVTRIGAASLLPPVPSATLANQIQKYLVENTRLGVPAIVHEESLAGYMARGATSFPQAIGLAATWEPELVQAMGDVIRQQMRVVGAHHTLAPVLDVTRDPRWGRLEETYGEDPFLISALGVAYIRGVQGEDLRNGIVATAKHFVGYGMSEGGLNWAPAHISKRELREVYLPPFMAAIHEGNVASVMNSYNEIDGIPGGASREMLVDVLRGELGFKGYIVSDYFTLKTLVDYHFIAKDKAAAAKLGLELGIDVELPTADCYGDPLRQAVERGDIEIALIDQCVQRVLEIKFRLGLFENAYVQPDRVSEVYNTPQQLDLSRRLAHKSIVLLKNDNDLLPLKSNLKTIAVIGPNAHNIRALQGDYHYPLHLERMFDPTVSADAPNPNQPVTSVDWDQHYPPSTTVLEGIRAAVSSGTQVLYTEGCTVLGDDTSGFAEAVHIAQQADVAILVVGDKSGLALGASSGESIDRASLDLPGVQQQLVEQVFATGTPTIVVLLNGRPFSLEWIAQHIPAVLEAWQPAQEGGTAVADVLFGTVSPGGKLPITFPRTVGQIPIYYSHKPSGGRTHWQGDYIDSSAKPLFAFGHGLSYTCFEYSNLIVAPDKASAADTNVLTIHVDVKNVGPRVGDEVVQLYIHDCIGTVTRPVKALKGFKRLTLQPGEQCTVTFSLAMGHLGFFDQQMQFVVEPGEFEIMIGSASDDIRLCSTVEIVGATTPIAQVFSTPVEVK